MDKFDGEFLKKCEELTMDEYMSELFIYLKENNDEYMSLFEEKTKMELENEKLSKIVSCDYEGDLTAKEVNLLEKYLDILNAIKNIEAKEMFLRGIKEFYFLAKKVDILK